MKVFVAMRPDQPEGWDFSDTVDGELVCMPFDRCGELICDCALTMVGLASGEATTTYTISELPHLNEELLVEAFIDGLAKQGHIDPGTDEGRAVGRDYAIEHIEMAALLPEGGIYRAIHPPAA
jgi:hypothetical protein